METTPAGGPDRQSDDAAACAFGLPDCESASVFDEHGAGLCQRCYDAEIAAGDNRTLREDDAAFVPVSK